MRLHPRRVLGRPVGRRLRLRKVGRVEPRPTALLLVPPDQLLALAPGPALRIGAGPVVEDAPVVRPGEAPPVPVRTVRVAPERPIHPIGSVAARVDPAAARRRAVLPQRGDAGELRPVVGLAGRIRAVDGPRRPAAPARQTGQAGAGRLLGRGRLLAFAPNGTVGVGAPPRVDVPTVDLGQHRLHERFAVCVLRVPPVQGPERLVTGVVALACLRDQPPGELVDEPGLAGGISRGLHGLLAPLEHALGLGEGAFLLHVARGREQEHLGGDLLRIELAPAHLGRVRAPERGGLDLHQVPHDQPLELRQGAALESRVLGAHGGVLSHDEQPLHLPIGHLEPVGEVGVVPGDPREPAPAPVVLRRRPLAVVGLEQAHRVRSGSRAKDRPADGCCGSSPPGWPRPAPPSASSGSRAGCRTASECRWTPGSRRVRGARECRRRAGPCCPGGAA